MKGRTVERYVAYVPPDGFCALDSLIAERARQDGQWGGAEHDDAHAQGDWLRFIQKQVGLAFAHLDDPAAPASDREAYRERLVKIAALAVAGIESLDRKAAR